MKEALDQNGMKIYKVGNNFFADHAQAKGNVSESSLKMLWKSPRKKNVSESAIDQVESALIQFI